MRICAVFDHSDNPVTLQDIDQLRDLSNDDIRQGLEDVKKAEQVLRAALVLDAILSKFASTSRFRNSRVEENARTVSSAQHLFTEWSPGTVYRLLLLSKPDVESIVQDSVLREGLKNRAIDYDVPASFTPKLKNYGWDTSFLRKKFRIPQDDISPFGVNCSPTEPLTQHTLEQTRCMPSGLISSNLRDTTPDHRAPSMIIPSKRRRVSIVPEDASSVAFGVPPGNQPNTPPTLHVLSSESNAKNSDETQRNNWSSETSLQTMAYFQDADWELIEFNDLRSLQS